LSPLVESAGEVYEQDCRHRDEAEGGDDKSQPSPLAAARHDSEQDGDEAEGNQ
jgi:hypothetical protein